ncbi:MAG: hypothetical protein U0168_15095 [Nannocystaceae bacterium]
MSRPRTRAVALALLAALSVACRSGVGDNCVCKSDCRPGLVCAQNGSPITTECAYGDLNAAPAVCIEEDQAPTTPPAWRSAGLLRRRRQRCSLPLRWRRLGAAARQLGQQRRQLGRSGASSGGSSGGTSSSDTSSSSGSSGGRPRVQWTRARSPG